MITHACRHAGMQACRHACMHACMHKYIHIHTRVYIYIYTFTRHYYTHTHIYIYIYRTACEYAYYIHIYTHRHHTHTDNNEYRIKAVREKILEPSITKRSWHRHGEAFACVFFFFASLVWPTGMVSTICIRNQNMYLNNCFLSLFSERPEVQIRSWEFQMP